MILNRVSDMAYLQFSHLAEFHFIRHGIFTRAGGVSPSPYDTLNVSFSTGDDASHIKKNRALVHTQMGAAASIYAHQIHKDGILHVKDSPSDTNLTFRNGGEGDAMITSVSGINLTLQVADCQPILLADPVKKVVAAVHSGWRGSVLNIVGTAVSAMTSQYGCNPTDIRAGVGPSLGPCCAEFINYETELPKNLWHYKDDRDHFDFWSVTKDQLLNSGLLEDHIVIGGICTKCHPTQFFSYRKENRTGRFAAVIGLTL